MALRTRFATSADEASIEAIENDAALDEARERGDDLISLRTHAAVP